MSDKRVKNTPIEKSRQYFSEHATRCKCGHTMLIISKDGKKLCPYCKEFVFINKEAEIKYRNKEALIKARRELNDK